MKRVIECRLTVNMGIAAQGMVKILIATNCLPSEDLDLVKSLLFACPAAIDGITKKDIREISHVLVNTPVKKT